MRLKILRVAVLFAAVICAVGAVLIMKIRMSQQEDVRSGQIVALNEIEKLGEAGETVQMSERIAELQEQIENIQSTSDVETGIVVLCAVCLLFEAGVFCYIYFAVLRPFDKMKAFAEKIAQGNFDLPLRYERSNYFGEFTWAFDSMRLEITRARADERLAAENNKTIIATLSHDIKTPVSSIRAYAEALEANLGSGIEKRQKYMSVIMKKCDEVSRLTDDLFLHSLSDLDMLKIVTERVELCGFLKKVIVEIAGEREDIFLSEPGFECCVNADCKRLTQIIENIINNSRKYAKTHIDICLKRSDGYVSIVFRDYGKGIPDKDIPFVFGKFYRGGNCGDEQGSGLGLYIVKYTVERQGGRVTLHNLGDGLEVTVSLPEA